MAILEETIVGRSMSGAQRPREGSAAAPRPLLSVDPDKAGDDLVRLVFALVETIRQLVERQAIRRVDSGTLTDEEVERLGLALLSLEERMSELKEQFGMSDDDLTLRLGPLHELVEDGCDDREG